MRDGRSFEILNRKVSFFPDRRHFTMEGGQKQPVPDELDPDVEELDPEVEELEVADVSEGGGVPPTELIFDVRTVRKVPWK